MYKLLIADDEPLIVRGLAKMIRNRLPEIEIVGEVTTCRDAYQVILTASPDLVITDIEMNGENGLRLPEEAAWLAQPPAFIIVSGYSRFDYAQRALRNGVEEYLLKPIDDDELIAVLQKMMARIQTRLEMTKRLQTSEETSVESSLHVLLLGGDAAQGTLSAAMREQLLARLHAPDFAVMRFFFGDAAMQTPDQAHLRPAMERAMQACFAPQAFVLIKGFHPGVYLAIVNGQGISALRIQAAAQTCLDVLRAEFSLTPVVGLSNTIQDMMQLQLCGEQANHAIMMHIYEPARNIYPYALVETCLQLLPPDTDTRQAALADSLRLPDADALREQTMSLYRHLYALRVAPTQILHCFADVLRRVQADGRPDIPEMQTLISERIQTLRNVMKYAGDAPFQACLEESMAEVNELLSLRTSVKSRRIIEKAKHYIQEHCEQEIMLVDVADALQMSPNYLSFLFKQETAVNFSAYVTYCRVNRAKQLLANRPDLRIYEIAEASGYRNVKYFNRIFKQETALKPSEFRERYAKS